MSAWMNFYTLTHNYCPWKSHFQYLLLYLPLWWISLGAGKWSSRTGSRCHRWRQWRTSTWCYWGFGTGTRSAGEWTSSSSCRQLSPAWATPRNGGLEGRTLHREVRTWSLLPFLDTFILLQPLEMLQPRPTYHSPFCNWNAAEVI